MWQIYEYTEYTNPDYLDQQTDIHIHPKIFKDYQDLAHELSEICNRHERQLALRHNKTINNFRAGIPTLAELNSTPTGTDYQAYSISIDMGQQKTKGYIKICS
jgi:predicted glycoside hydrolase/deacetylase ChbG (UPF0249 family)